MTKGSITRPNRPMSARKAKLEAERRAYLSGKLMPLERNPNYPLANTLLTIDEILGRRQ